MRGKEGEEKERRRRRGEEGEEKERRGEYLCVLL